MKRVLKWVAIGLLAVILLATSVVYAVTEQRFGRHFKIEVAPLSVPPTTDAAALERGKHLATTRGCLECHGARGEGRLFLDEMPVMVLMPANLTPGGPVGKYTNEDWARAVRHGVRPDGSAILFMPCEDYAELDDRDLGQIVAYLRTLPSSSNDPGRTRIGPMGRLLYLAGKLPLVAAERLKHEKKVPPAPPEERSVAYGRYLAQACVGCHGGQLSGGPIPGVPPEWPEAANLTPDPSGVKGMSEQAFLAVMRQGRSTRGKSINPEYMPWSIFKNLTDVELGAVYDYLKTLPPRPAGGR